MDQHYAAIIEICVFLIGFAGFVWKIGKDRQIDIDSGRAYVDSKVEERDKMINRVYERMDEVKRDFEGKIENCKGDAENKFVQVKICKILHDSAEQNFQRLDKKVDCLCDKIDKIHNLLVPQK